MGVLEDIDNQLQGTDEAEANPERVNPLGKDTDRALRNINTGIARSLGVGKAVADFFMASSPPEVIGNFITDVAGEPREPTPDVPIPSGPEIQKYFAEIGIAFGPEEEPNTMSDRIVQNIGSALVFAPLFPLTGATLAIEGVAATTGAVMGKYLQDNTDFGRNNPDLARAVGEITGGLGGGVSAAGLLGIATAVTKFVKGGLSAGLVFRKTKDLAKKAIPPKERRAATRIRQTDAEIEEGIANLTEAASNPAIANLSVAEQTGTLGAARLQKTVEQAVPEVEAALRQTRNANIAALEKSLVGEGDISKARQLLELKQARLMDEASDALRVIRTTDDPAKLSTIVKGKLRDMYDDARKVESRLWNKQPKSLRVNSEGSEINKFFIDVQRRLKSDTGSFRSDVDSTLFQKLGTRQPVRVGKRGRPRLELQGGELFVLKRNADGEVVSSASVQSMHSFYSKLGERVQKLSTIRGQAPKIRLLNQARAAIFKDLDRAGAGEEYRKLIGFSRDLNNKFTKGAVGKVLGFERGDIPFETQSLDIILGSGGEVGLQNAKQALQASPQSKVDMGNFLKARFALFAKNDLNDKVNVNKGRQFIEKHNDLLDELFPDVKAQLDDVITKQTSVDEISGVGQVSAATPLQKERAAAAFFLNQNPSEEMGKLLNLGNIQRTDYLRDIVKEVGKDSSGKALKGVKNAFGNEILKGARKSATDGTDVISGTQMLNRLGQLEHSAVSSKLFTQSEYDQLKRIGDAFRRVQFVRSAEPLSGGVINDLTSRLYSIPLRGLAATAGGRLGGKVGGMGGGLRTANILSQEMDMFLAGFTNDGAAALLIRSVVDRDLMLDLLTDAKNLTPKARQSLFGRIKAKSRELGSFAKGAAGDRIRGAADRVRDIEVPASALTPALATAAGGADAESVEARNREELLREEEEAALFQLLGL